MKCNKCYEILSDEYTKVDPNSAFDNPFESITTIEPYYLCNECANRLIEEEMN
tara:strand:+ start:273 stop:431 length:159 start_codon:yes stop_codon:yes gene_type:complete